MQLLELKWGHVPSVECSRLLLYQSIHLAVAYSTLPMVRDGPAWETLVRIHSVWYEPITHSIMALS